MSRHLSPLKNHSKNSNSMSHHLMLYYLPLLKNNSKNHLIPHPTSPPSSQLGIAVSPHRHWGNRTWSHLHRRFPSLVSFPLSCLSSLIGRPPSSPSTPWRCRDTLSPLPITGESRRPPLPLPPHRQPTTLVSSTASRVARRVPLSSVVLTQATSPSGHRRRARPGRATKASGARWLPVGAPTRCHWHGSAGQPFPR
jgi:hypothetical protein